MKMDKLTQKSQEALQIAQDLAGQQNHSQVEVEHLFLALLEQEESLAARDYALYEALNLLKGLHILQGR